MNLNDPNILTEAIRQYLEGGLTVEDQNALLDHVNTNPSALEKLKVAVYEFELNEILIRKSLKEKLLKRAELNSQNIENKPRAGWILGAIIALVCALLLVYIFVLPKEKATRQTPATKDESSPQNEIDSTQEYALGPLNEPTEDDALKVEAKPGKALFLRLYRIPEFNVLQLRGENSIRDSTTLQYIQAAEAFQKMEFKKALSFIPEKADDKKLSSSVQYLKAHSLLNLKRFTEAASILQVTAKDMYFERQDEARWYLMLCYIALDDFEKARKIQKEIIEDPYSSYSQEARKLSDQFNDSGPGQ
jgi:hypothetical protein